MAKVTIEYFGMDGTGATVTEAKKDAGRKIEEAIKGNWQPKVIASRGHAMLVWRDPHGWRSSMLTDMDSGDDKGNRTGFREELSHCSGVKEYTDAYASALSNMAQITWDGQEQIPPVLDEVKRLTGLGRQEKDSLGRRLLADFASWRGFQLAYQHAKANGIGTCDNEWHRWGCDHSREFMS